MRRLSCSLLAFMAVGVVGCEAGSESASPPPASAPSQEPAHADPKPPTGLEAALGRGIVPPSLDDGTYRVDPFVAVLIYERLRDDLQPLTRVEAEGAAPAGYAVGRLEPEDPLALLGLESGDIVEALNGRAIGDEAQLQLALDAAENRLTVTIFREDVSFTNSYRFDGGLAWRDVIAGGVADEVDAEPVAALDPPQPEPNPDAANPTNAPVRAQPKAGRGASSRSKARRPSPSKPSSSTPRPNAPAASDIRCSSSRSCTITKRKFDELRASPSKLRSGVDIVPAIRNDVFSGYKLKSVSSRSPVHALGFRAGDKVTHINGRDLTDDAQAMALYWSLGSSRVFKVRYERGGRPSVKTVRVL